MPLSGANGTSYTGTYTLTGEGANAVWGTWTTAASNVTSGTINTDAIWNSWTVDTADITASNVAANGLWRIWVDGAEQPQPAVWSNSPNPLHALKEKLQRRRKQRGIRESANRLLQLILTDEEWQEWRRYESVRIVGSGGGVYEVGVGWEGMLFKIGIDGEPEKKLCCHPSTRYPTADRVATMILALRADEVGVIRKANVHPFSDNEKLRVKARRAHRLRSVA